MADKPEKSKPCPLHKACCFSLIVIPDSSCMPRGTYAVSSLTIILIPMAAPE
jgi:hypothetical protein